MPPGIVHAASEVVGFAKTGGLADVAGALPRALARRGHDCALIMPLYRCICTGPVPLFATDHVITVPVGYRTVTGRLWRASLPDSNVPVYLVEQSDYFERDDPARGRGLYQFVLGNGSRSDYPDNCERFVFFSRAVLEILRLLHLWPDVLHLHDWQTGLIPVYLQEEYRRHPYAPLREHYQRIRTVFTIHNANYQGVFPTGCMQVTGLDHRLYNQQQLEYYGHISFLKAGMVFSDWLTTVSPTYAREIQTPYFGGGLQGVLSERRDRLVGIVNGVDYGVWDPAIDPHIAQHYDPDTVIQGKPACKAALQRRFGLPEEASTPLLGMVARLVEQKGLDLLGRTADAILGLGTQLVVLGEGDPGFHYMLMGMRDRYPRQVAISLEFDDRLAHQIEAGADIFLMPSQYEPSGLNQLYSLKYGTVPVVRATGGLADTIVDCTPGTMAAGTATGFNFAGYTREAFLEAVQRAVAMYRGEPEPWLQLVRNGMRQDWSWDRSAADYERLYERCQEG